MGRLQPLRSVGRSAPTFKRESPVVSACPALLFNNKKCRELAGSNHNFVLKTRGAKAKQSWFIVAALVLRPARKVARVVDVRVERLTPTTVLLLCLTGKLRGRFENTHTETTASDTFFLTSIYEQSRIHQICPRQAVHIRLTSSLSSPRASTMGTTACGVEGSYDDPSTTSSARRIPMCGTHAAGCAAVEAPAEPWLGCPSASPFLKAKKCISSNQKPGKSTLVMVS